MPNPNGPPAPPKGNQRAKKEEPKDALIQIRCKPSTKDIIKEVAQAEGQSLSEWMLSAALEKIARM